MTEVSGDVSGAAVANGSGRRRRTRAAEEAVGGGDFCKIKNRTKRGFALGKATNCANYLVCVGREGQTSHYNAKSKSHRTQ